ncbi:MAG: ADOP family duplicated permease [Acidobacteriota bacterium]|nr:ADOP family duplicated permease [Acidobacteriota bacterium]
MRRAIRQVTRAPGLASSVVGVLALTVGALTAILSILNAVALRPLPLRNPGQLVALSTTDERGQQARMIYHATVVEIAKQSAFETLGLYSGGGVLWAEARGVATEGGIEAVTPGFHEALGLAPVLGRFFDPTDGPAGGPAAAVTVISHRFWRRHYASDPSAIGDRLLINAVSFTIIGVMPPEYTGLYIEMGVDFSVPAAVLGRQLATNQFPSAPARPLRGLNAVGRLRQGVSLDQARTVIEAAWPTLRANAIPPGLNATELSDVRTQRIKLESLANGFSNLRTRRGDLLFALAWTTALLLAIGCVNLAGLLLARTADRRHEWAIHIALGATGGRLARQILIESWILSVVGIGAGIFIAWWASQALTNLLWESATPLMLSVTPDWRVLGWTAAASFGISALIGVLPAWSASRHTSLRPVRSVTSVTGRWAKGLLVAQVALSLVLIFTAGLFAATLARLRGLDSGVPTDNIRWTRLFAQPGGYRDLNDATYYPDLVDRLSALPGIDSVALSHHFPAFFNFGSLVAEYAIAKSGAANGAEAATGMMEFVSPKFFETVGIPVLGGRDIRWSDDLQNPAVTIVNEALSRRLFPAGDAIGQRIRIGDDPARRSVEIIGIVRDATMGGYRVSHQPVAFRPKAQEPRFFRTPVVVFRTSVEASSIDRAVADTVSRMGREYARRLYSLEEQIDIALNQERLMAWLSSAGAACAALTSSIGLFALLTHSVSRRTREIGLRMALGASRPVVLGMVLRDGLSLTLAGVAIGIPCALAAGRLTASMLFGLSSSDPTMLAAGSLLFVLVSVLACFGPALRASMVSPTSALRSE